MTLGPQGTVLPLLFISSWPLTCHCSDDAALTRSTSSHDRTGPGHYPFHMITVIQDEDTQDEVTQGENSQDEVTQDDTHGHDLRHGGAGGRVAGVAGGGHLDGVDPQLVRQVLELRVLGLC